MNKKLNNILISNDDGYESVGLKVLLSIAEQLADNVLIVSPKINQSAKSKSITIKQNINFREMSKNFWIVDGTPTDCIIFALNYLLKRGLKKNIVEEFKIGFVPWKNNFYENLKKDNQQHTSNKNAML